MCTAYATQVHSLYFVALTPLPFLPPPFYKPHLVGFIMLSQYICVTHFNPTHSPGLSPLPLATDPRHSCPIIVINIILSVDFTDEQKHVLFGFLSLAYLTVHDNLQFLLFSVPLNSRKR
jgi:hypothetical protein